MRCRTSHCGNSAECKGKTGCWWSSRNRWDAVCCKRFGFESASKYGIHLEGVPVEDEAPFFMVKTLKEDALKGTEGNFIFDECYNVKEKDVDEFDKNFEPKKKEVREGQLK